jgi:3-hydroxybutyryl-CoA dehydrogenase
MIDTIKKIAVIGAGTMGQGIAQLCASAGFSVLLYDVQPEIIKDAIAQIRKNLDALAGKGKITSQQRDSTIGRIEAAGDFRLLQVELVIEAVVEKLDVKQKIFLEIEKYNDQECILVSNTSSISITQIGSVLKHPGRFAGLHFFNPAPVMKLVEVIRGAATEDQYVTLLQNFCTQLSKVNVLAKDSPGFIVNRIARPFYTESLKIAEESVSTYQDIDQLLKASGFRMGPFELMDFIGIDINYAVTASMHQAFHGETKFRPNPLQQQKVLAGHLGRKSGKGFYQYD